MRSAGEPTAAARRRRDRGRQDHRPLPEAVEGVTAVELGRRHRRRAERTITAHDDVRAAVCRALVQAGHDLIKLDTVERELENIFIHLVGGTDASN